MIKPEEFYKQLKNISTKRVKELQDLVIKKGNMLALDPLSRKLQNDFDFIKNTYELNKLFSESIK